MKPVHWQRATPFTASLLLTIAVSGAIAPAVRAQFSSPPGQGTPQSTAGGGTRGRCPQQSNHQESLLALAPTRSVGLTSQSSPSFWVYLPPTKAKTLEFSLLTQQQEGIYQTNLPIDGSGLLEITLPAKVVELKPGQLYRWSIALVCNPDDRAEDWVVRSSIQHQPLNPVLQRQLAAATLEQQIKLYAQSGFWSEAFNTYLKLRQTQPNHLSLTAIWAELVQAAGLSPIVTPSAERLQPAAPAPLAQVLR